MMRIMQVCKVHILSIAALTAVLALFSCLLFTADAEAYSETDVVYTEGITGGAVYFDKSTGTITDCDESVTAAVIPASIEDVEVTAIGDGAFSVAVNLNTIVIPASVEVFGENIFQGCSENMVIYCMPGSAAEGYAIENRINYKFTAKLSQAINSKSKIECTYGCNPIDLEASAHTMLFYESSNTDVAEVSSDGIVTAKAGGTAVITITAESTDRYESAEKKVSVKVNKASQTITLNRTRYSGIYTYNGGGWEIRPRCSTECTFKNSNSNLFRMQIRKSGTYKYAHVQMINPGKATITVTAKETAQYKKATKTVSLYSYLKKPQIQLRRYSKGRIQISWKVVPGANKYQVYIYDPSKKKYVLRLTKGSQVKSVMHRGLKAGKTYRYKVRAYRVVNGKKVYSSFSEPKKAVARK